MIPIMLAGFLFLSLGSCAALLLATLVVSVRLYYRRYLPPEASRQFVPRGPRSRAIPWYQGPTADLVNTANAVADGQRDLFETDALAAEKRTVRDQMIRSQVRELYSDAIRTAKPQGEAPSSPRFEDQDVCPLSSTREESN